MGGQHRRCLQLLRGSGAGAAGAVPSEAGDAAAPLTETNVRFRYLAARCLAAVGDWDAVLGLLATPSGDKDLEELSPMVLCSPRASLAVHRTDDRTSGPSSSVRWRALVPLIS